MVEQEKARFKTCEYICNQSGLVVNPAILTEGEDEPGQKYSCSLGKEDCPILYFARRIQGLDKWSDKVIERDMASQPFNAQKPSS